MSSTTDLIRAMAAAITSHKDYLTELDAAIGDADHGVNMDRGFQSVLDRLPEVENQPPGEILKAVGMTLVSTVGGASGPLYGTAFMYAGNQAGAREDLSFEDVAAMFQAALDGILRRGKANVGDKTMVDTLAPVVQFLASNEARESPRAERVNRALEVARDGMESTRDRMALKGRASFLKERSIGHLDPGAVSCYLLLEVIGRHVLNGA